MPIARAQSVTAPPAASGHDSGHLRSNMLAGVTTGVVALPLALAFGEASGAGPMAGLWGAIILGFIAALLGGTPTLVSGPTGPMVVVFAGFFAALGGEPALVAGAVVLGGAAQVLIGLAGWGRYIRLVPYPVVSGFMSGIGVVIIVLQIARLFGHEPEGGGAIPALSAVPAAVADPVVPAVVLGGLALAVVFLWPARWGRVVPGPSSRSSPGRSAVSCCRGRHCSGTSRPGSRPSSGRAWLPTRSVSCSRPPSFWRCSDRSTACSRLWWPTT